MKVSPLRTLPTLLLLVSIAALGGCGSSDEGGSSGADPTAVPTAVPTTGGVATTGPVTTGGKPLVPLDVGLVLPDAPLEIGQRFRVTLQLAPQEAVSAVRAEVKGSGVVRLDHLDHERAAGRVSEIDYQRLREEILGGGSTTTP